MVTINQTFETVRTSYHCDNCMKQSIVGSATPGFAVGHEIELISDSLQGGSIVIFYPYSKKTLNECQVC